VDLAGYSRLMGRGREATLALFSAVVTIGLMAIGR
jgi:hypothetical protein